MRPALNRRQWLGWSSGIAAIGLSAATAAAMQPIPRAPGNRWKLGLAGYSLRKYFQAPADAPEKLNLDGFLDYCAKLGVDGAELTQYYFPDSPTHEQLVMLKRHAHLVGVEICGGAIRNNFTVEPGAPLQKELDHVQRWGRHYATLGAPAMRVFAGQPGSGISEEDAVRRVAEALQQACAAASEHGVILAIENHDFTTKVDRLLAILDQVDSPWLGVNFDGGNFGGTDDPYGAMEKLAPYAVSAQIKVAMHTAGGQQQADWPRILGILRDAGYSGYITLEYEEADEPYEVIPRYLDQLRKLIG
jgi:sugar phosphate isomerase/epimerase